VVGSEPLKAGAIRAEIDELPDEGLVLVSEGLVHLGGGKGEQGVRVGVICI